MARLPSFARWTRVLPGLVILASIVGHGHAIGGAVAADVVDGFEASALDGNIWSTAAIPAKRYRLDRSIVRSGRQSIAVSVHPKDESAGEPGIQRSELWLRKPLWLPRDAPAWYSFSFRMSGDIPTTGSVRWVINQWKEQDSGHSPFLAQRFDNGVFHITVEDNDCRVTIASAPGDPDGLGASGPFMPSARRPVTVDRRHPALSRGPFVDCQADVQVEKGETGGVLPSPIDQWVDMVYYVRRGRAGTGLVEVWANGRFVSRAKGSIGAESNVGPLAYFRFGSYRNAMPHAATMHFDGFKRSDTKP